MTCDERKDENYKNFIEYLQFIVDLREGISKQLPICAERIRMAGLMRVEMSKYIEVGMRSGPCMLIINNTYYLISSIIHKCLTRFSEMSNYVNKASSFSAYKSSD
jgi:hypothetical protein